MIMLYASAALVLALVSLPVALATVSREQGWRIIDRAWQLVATVPNLLADSLDRWKGEVLSRSRSALRETNVQTCGQALAVLASVLVALIGLSALIINSISTLAGLQGSQELIVEVLSAVNITAITLMGLEMGLACFYFPALLFDALGITHFFYVFLRVSSSTWPKWRRVAVRLLIGLLALVGTVGAGYVLHETGILRERVVETSSSESLLESSGLSSGDNPSSQAAPDPAAPNRAAPSQADSRPGDEANRKWATYVSATWPSLLGFFTGTFAFANSIPAMAFLAAGISALLWLLLVPVRALAYVVAALLARARSLMLSLFNLTLELQDKPPVGSVKAPVQKNEDTGLQTMFGGPASPEKKAGEETSSERISSEEGADSDRQFANDGPEEKGPGDDGLERSDRDKTGPGEASRDETGRGETGHDGTDRDETSHDSTAASGGKDTSLEDTFSLNEKSITGRVFQPWWFKNPHSQRPSSPDDADKEPGCFYGTLGQAAKASRSRKASRRACVLELRLRENGDFDFLRRHELPLRESGENA
ncbi:hypothetical protein [Salinibacter ruber]|uniref:hypothetical protein n=1 Tax=Salinibacter ruber TaxID=146919 RepID=UPI00216A39D1|nr:hypothetical protein [Salinibacter ruber]MCS3613372.1 hypothetical protein [Salinibacter ruber]